MSRFTPIALGLALPVSFVSQAALADLAPADVWGDWRSYMEDMGYELSATETPNGDDLTVSDIALSFAAPDGTGSMNLTMDRVEFRQNADGTVAVVLPDSMPIRMTGTDSANSDEDFSMLMTYSQSGHALTASGDPEAMTYLYTAATAALDMTQMQMGGETQSAENATVSFEATNINSSTTMTLGDMRAYQQAGSVETVSYSFAFTDPEMPASQGAVTGSVEGLSFTGTGSIPMNVEPGADMALMLDAGFDVNGTLSYMSGSSNFDIKDPENGDYVMATSSQGGDLGVKMSSDGLAYDVKQRDVTIAVTAAEMPFPFEIAMAENGFNLAVPVSQSDDPQDFALGVTLRDFTMSDMIWGIFDPSAQLPRDPATVLVDLRGTVKLLVDYLNPEMAEQMDEVPGELKSVNLSNLLVSAAGAQLDGSGAITFDGAADGLVPGSGNPVGDVNLSLAGGNALIDKLVAMGLLPAEQAMGARMMIGLFAVPGDAPDTLKSRIEFTADGQILANGQRIR